MMLYLFFFRRVVEVVRDELERSTEYPLDSAAPNCRHSLEETRIAVVKAPDNALRNDFDERTIVVAEYHSRSDLRKPEDDIPAEDEPQKAVQTVHRSNTDPVHAGAAQTFAFRFVESVHRFHRGPKEQHVEEQRVAHEQQPLALRVAERLRCFLHFDCAHKYATVKCRYGVN